MLTAPSIPPPPPPYPLTQCISTQAITLVFLNQDLLLFFFKIPSGPFQMRIGLDCFLESQTWTIRLWCPPA